MRGIPKWFNTIEDVLNSMKMDKDATKAKLQEMLDGVRLGRHEEAGRQRQGR